MAVIQVSELGSSDEMPYGTRMQPRLAMCLQPGTAQGESQSLCSPWLAHLRGPGAHGIQDVHLQPRHGRLPVALDLEGAGGVRAHWTAGHLRGAGQPASRRRRARRVEQQAQQRCDELRATADHPNGQSRNLRRAAVYTTQTPHSHPTHTILPPHSHHNPHPTHIMRNCAGRPPTESRGSWSGTRHRWCATPPRNDASMYADPWLRAPRFPSNVRLCDRQGPHRRIASCP